MKNKKKYFLVFIFITLMSGVIIFVYSSFFSNVSYKSKLLSFFVERIRKYDILNYKINLSFEPEFNLAKINSAISVKITKENQQRISFLISPRIKNLKRITCDKENIKRYYLKPFLYLFKQIIITFDKPLIKNEILCFTMDYEIKYDGKGMFYGIIEKDYIELRADSMFYPFIFNDLFKFELTINADKDFYFVSNAKLEKFTQRNERNILHFVSIKNTFPICLIGGKYKTIRRKRDNLTMQIMTIKNGILNKNKGLLNLMFKHLYEILSFYKGIFGEDEDIFNEFTLVERKESGNENDSIWYGTENFVAISGSIIRKLINKYKNKELEEQIIIYLSHEISHHYFGNILFVKDFLPGGVWLKEGFAQYSAFLYIDSFYNKKNANKIFWIDEKDIGIGGLYNWYLKTLLKKKKFLSLSSSTYLDAPDREIAYTRGAWVLHTLRYIVGDETFFKILREYVEKFWNNFVTLKDFENVVENNYEGEIQWFFDDWLYTNHNLDYSVKDVAINKSNDVYLLEFKIENLGKLTMKVPIEVLIKSQNDEKIIKLFLMERKNDFIIPIKTDFKKIVVDPNYWILDVNRKNNIFYSKGGNYNAEISKKVNDIKLIWGDN